MMRRLVERHRGILPLDTAESIWRVIIATFTYVQAPFRLHADLSAGDAAMRDSARFHFGFTVPFVTHIGASGVVAAVAARKATSGLVPAIPMAGSGAWWTALEGNAPKIIARLPFLERADHPAGFPVFAIARPHPDAIVTDVEMWSIKVSGWGPRPAQALAAVTEAIAVPDGAFDGAALLVSVPREKKLADALACAGEGRRIGALAGPRREPREALYGRRRRHRLWLVPDSEPLPHLAHAPMRTSENGHQQINDSRAVLDLKFLYGGRCKNDRNFKSTALVNPLQQPESLSNDSIIASPTARGRPQDRRLCAGQKRRTRRRARVQAVVQRDPAWPEPEGDRRLSGGCGSFAGLPGRRGHSTARGDWSRVRTRPGAHCVRGRVR